MKWTAEQEQALKDAAASSETSVEAWMMFRGATKLPVTHDAFDRKLRRLVESGAVDFTFPKASFPKAAEKPDRPSKKILAANNLGDAEVILQYLRKRPGTASDIGDRLDWPPRRVLTAFRQARTKGYAVEEFGGELVYRPSTEEMARRIDLGDPDAAEGMVTVASDLHFGSKFHCHEFLRDHLIKSYREGSRLTFIPGDLVTGDYKFDRYERTHHGHEAQITLALDRKQGLPRLKNHQYVITLGNHDQTHEENSGIDFGRCLIDRARSLGRKDIVWAGTRGAYVAYNGVLFNLWHPKKGSGYALSYLLQNWVRDLGDQPRPNVLLCGHTHRECRVRAGKTVCFLLGTFQHGASRYGRSLGGGVALGGFILDWNRKDRRLSRLRDEFRYYYGPPPFTLPISSAAADSADDDWSMF